MIDFLVEFLQGFGIKLTMPVVVFVVLAVIVVGWLLTHAVLIYGFWGAVKRCNRKNPREWLTILINSNVFVLFVVMVQWIIVSMQIRLWIPEQAGIFGFFDALCRLLLMVFVSLFIFSCINFTNNFLSRKPLGKTLPVNGIAQALKIVVGVIFVISVVSLLLNRSPLLILSGLGAMTAVLMLIFQDSIRGFTAGIQLSIYNLLAVGDWVEIPKYNADGDVIEIGLTTVKIQNWDKTIASVPTYALISDSFKNWRGMSLSGGRRMKRSIFIDVTSIHFLSEEEIARLKRASLLGEYLESKSREVGEYNKNLGADLTSPVNGRHLTNVGTFRAYLAAYLKANPNVHKGLTQMVRQLAPTPEGLPLEIYAFTATTEWTSYENIQGDIFDHIFSVLPEFGLRAYQAPSGSDIRGFGRSCEAE